MRYVIDGLSAADYVPHTLHGAERDWTETNCYVDLWIELLNARGDDPRASLGFTAALDFEGDQFTFFKFPLEDLERVHGAWVGELSIYDGIEAHAAEQIARGRMTLVEVDAFFLPDTRGVSYQLEHTKTTIGINGLDVEGRRLAYFHNAGYFTLDGADFEGVFQRANPPGPMNTHLFPYVEFVKFGAPLQGAARRDAAIELLHHHLARAPKQNPVRAFACRIEDAARDLATRDPAFFHKYAFNTLRQVGANFELLSSHLEWLAEAGAPRNDDAARACKAISTSAKSFQFQLARAVTRRRFEGLGAMLDGPAQSWDDAIGTLRADFGG
jgi:hypothetical protein